MLAKEDGRFKKTQNDDDWIGQKVSDEMVGLT